MALKRIMASPVCVPFWVAPWKRAMSVLLLLVASLQLPLASGINISRWPSWQYFPFTNASSLPANPVKRIEVQLLVNPNPPPEPHAVTLLKGVVAVSPTSRLSFPHSSIPPSSPAFSVSLCVFLTEDSTGAVRTLFSRGANTNQRTPSLALLKNSRRLLFKVTTLFRPEISATSARQLPLLRWSHVTLTSDGYRTLTLFLDGAPDGTLYTGSDVILGNGGPFALGRDHLLDGAAALVSGLKWFPYELTREQIANERREAFANLPQFGDLAQGEANARGVWDPDSKLEWKPSEQIVAEAGFVWRGEVAGSPPAADTPTFVGALSGGVKNGLEGQDNADILLKSKSCNSFPTMAQERTCPVSSFSPKSLLVDASTAVESESICIGDGSEELAEAQSFWELIHTNAGPVVELDRHSMKPEVRTVGRPNSEFVEEVARLAIARLSPFRTAARFLKPFYLAMDLLQGEGLQGSKEGSASNVPDVLEDGLDGPGVKRLQPGTPEPFHTGSPEGEKAYRARIAKQQFEEGRAAVVEGARAEGSGVQLRRLKQGLDLLRQAAEGGLGLAHLELAYVMARHSAEFEQKLQRTALDLLSEQVANRGSDLEGTVKSDEGRVSGGVVSIGGVSHQPDPRGAKLKGDDVTATQKLVEGGSMTSLESPDLEKRIPGDSSSETEGRNRWVLEGAGLRNGTPVVPWQQQITYHFLRATAAGVDEAFAALGYRTLFGLGVAQCNESARFFFEKAAEVAVQTWQVRRCSNLLCLPPHKFLSICFRSFYLWRRLALSKFLSPVSQWLHLLGSRVHFVTCWKTEKTWVLFVGEWGLVFCRAAHYFPSFFPPSIVFSICGLLSYSRWNCAIIDGSRLQTNVASRSITATCRQLCKTASHSVHPFRHPGRPHPMDFVPAQKITNTNL